MPITCFGSSGTPTRQHSRWMHSIIAVAATAMALSPAPAQARANVEAPKSAPNNTDDQAVAELRRLVSEGNVEAMLGLGMLLNARSENHLTVPAEVIRLWTQASDAGHPLGAFFLGVTYGSEKANVADPVKARHYLGLAVAGGARDAAIPYMSMLTRGEGGPVDLAQAERLLPFAAATHVGSNEEGNAIMVIRNIAQLPEWTSQPETPPVMVGGARDALAGLRLLAVSQNDADREQGQQTLAAAADAGDANAQVAMAVLLATGGDSQALGRAIGYTRSAAAQGDSDALFQLGASLCACSFDKAEVIRGLALLELASKRGSYNAFALRAQTLSMVDPLWATFAEARAEECAKGGIALCGILDEPFPGEKANDDTVNPDMIAANPEGPVLEGAPAGERIMPAERPTVVASVGGQ